MCSILKAGLHNKQTLSESRQVLTSELPVASQLYIQMPTMAAEAEEVTATVEMEGPVGDDLCWAPSFDVRLKAVDQDLWLSCMALC